MPSDFYNKQRQPILFFVSYAHSNRQLAEDFVKKLMDHLRPSKAFDYQLWMDSAIIAGDEWKSQIVDAIERCDLGLLLVSPAFLGSRFIGDAELPHFIGNHRAPSIPVMLQPVDLEFHNLKGLESLQIFRLTGKRFKEPRAYGECKSKARDDFILELFRTIERKLAEKTIISPRANGNT